ncbi:RNA-directed DNA polymerase [Streptomyces mutabilis]|uniref:RNA-directed DNA polymerase n=1 Tax=Streptomyces mutabilis TaxID=67332 RepID=UPI0022BA4445|nr:RNA-directed DNA polymerase [Streptomyces mutabilis]MCZ9351399.1 RNA-directed DNA polymerase [Streptomyces mutabilis]
MAKEEYLRRAARRLFFVEVRQELPDIINFSDIKKQWDTYKGGMIKYVSNPDVAPARVEIVEHPKDPISVRPLARFDIKDRLAYETLALEASHAVDKLIPSNIFSYRLKKNQIHSVHDWLAMRHRARKILLSDPGLMMARTDISAFYENIDIEILQLDLLQAGVEVSLVEQIRSFLEGFQHQSEAWGLPQGSSASGVLANIYLLPFDEYIRQSGIEHVRYSDDTYLFGSDWETLRSSLVGANQALRARRLTPSSKKTEILSRVKSIDYLDDAERDLIAYLHSLGNPQAKELLNKLFRNATSKTPPNERDVKFSLTRFRYRQDATAVDWALNNLKDLHHISAQILRYVEALPGYRKRLVNTLEAVVSDYSLIDYPFLERNILHCALRQDVRSKVLKDTAWAILRDRNRPNYPREFAARYIGRNSDVADGPLLKMQYESENSDAIKRALLIAMHECAYMPDALLRDIEKKRETDLSWTARYLRNVSDIPLPV